MIMWKIAQNLADERKSSRGITISIKPDMMRRKNKQRRFRNSLNYFFFLHPVSQHWEFRFRSWSLRPAVVQRLVVARVAERRGSVEEAEEAEAEEEEDNDEE